MGKVIVRIDGNWADEMDVRGWTFMEEEEWNDTKKRIENADYPLNWYIGTNEEIEFRDAAHLLGQLHAQPVSNEEANVLARHIPSHYRGMFPDFDDLLGHDDDE